MSRAKDFQTIFRVRCQHPTMTCHIIAADDTILHLTFCHATHMAALAWLHRTRPQSIIKKKAGPDFFFHRQFVEYLHGERRAFPLPRQSPFLQKGTPFQHKVWQAIGQIPYGETRTYGELAGILGGKQYARSAGQACHANPLALLVPCHRVVGQRGLGGFAGGISIKARLLAIERQGLREAGN